MKRLIIRNRIILLFILLASLNCNKEEICNIWLPPVSTSGKNSFGCILNGNGWHPQTPWSIWSQNPLMSSYYFVNGNFELEALKQVWTYPPGYLSADQKLTLGLQYIGGTSFEVQHVKIQFFDGNSPCNTVVPNTLYELADSPNNYFKIIHFDTANAILSAVFSFDLTNPNCKDTLALKNGRMDLKFWKRY
jgi:hypothetical protein